MSQFVLAGQLRCLRVSFNFFHYNQISFQVTSSGTGMRKMNGGQLFHFVGCWQWVLANSKYKVICKFMSIRRLNVSIMWPQLVDQVSIPFRQSQPLPTNNPPHPPVLMWSGVQHVGVNMYARYVVNMHVLQRAGGERKVLSPFFVWKIRFSDYTNFTIFRKCALPPGPSEICG